MIGHERASTLYRNLLTVVLTSYKNQICIYKFYATGRGIFIAPQIFTADLLMYSSFPRSLRGNAVTDAPRRVQTLMPVLSIKRDAEHPISSCSPPIS
jgi:hypothetical protein